MDIIKEALKEAQTTLSEHESKELLRTYDIPVTRERETADQQGFMRAVQEVGFPLVIKASVQGLGPSGRRPSVSEGN